MPSWAGNPESPVFPRAALGLPVFEAPMLPPAKTPDADGLDPGCELPKGRHCLSPEVVAGDQQRERLILAVAEALAEHGYASFTVEQVLQVADVSRATFCNNFAGKQDAVEAAQDVVFERFLGLLRRACSAQQEWPIKVKVAIGASLDFAAAAPAQAQLLSLDGLVANRQIARRAIDGRDNLAALLAVGRRHVDRGPQLPSLTEQFLIAGLMSAISTRILHGEAKRLPELAPQLVQFTLLPYLGQAEAERVATRPRPAPPGR
jgi:AcrR family transcriptional regulator